MRGVVSFGAAAQIRRVIPIEIGISTARMNVTKIAVTSPESIPGLDAGVLRKVEGRAGTGLTDAHCQLAPDASQIDAHAGDLVSTCASCAASGRRDASRSDESI